MFVSTAESRSVARSIRFSCGLTRYHARGLRIARRAGEGGERKTGTHTPPPSQNFLLSRGASASGRGAGAAGAGAGGGAAERRRRAPSRSSSLQARRCRAGAAAGGPGGPGPGAARTCRRPAAAPPAAPRAAACRRRAARAACATGSAASGCGSARCEHSRRSPRVGGRPPPNGARYSQGVGLPGGVLSHGVARDDAAVEVPAEVVRGHVRPGVGGLGALRRDLPVRRGAHSATYRTFGRLSRARRRLRGEPTPRLPFISCLNSKLTRAWPI